MVTFIFLGKIDDESKYIFAKLINNDKKIKEDDENFVKKI